MVEHATPQNLSGAPRATSRDFGSCFRKDSIDRVALFRKGHRPGPRNSISCYGELLTCNHRDT
jgi:hypothetical protein